MFAIIFRRRVWVPPRDSISFGSQYFGPQLVVFIKSFSSKKLSPGVCGNDSEKSFTVSYLINSCGLSSADALSVSKKLSVKSPEKSDAVLESLRKYGFTNAHIARLIAKWPRLLYANPKKTLLPKLEFFCSIGAPAPILAEKVSFYPTILGRSLKKCIIPWYNTLKTVVQSDKRVVYVFFEAMRGFVSIPSKIAMFRGRGLPESSIAYMLSRTPSLMNYNKERLAAAIDQAAEMGFDKEKTAFADAVLVFGLMTESKLKYKRDVYRRCGWSESDINVAFFKFPNCMEHSENKIMAVIGFLVNKMGVKPTDVAHRPWLLCYSVDKRIKPRCLVAAILNAKGLNTKLSVASLLTISEKKFMKRYIDDYQDDIPQLLDIYRGKLSINDMGFSQDVIEKILI